MQLKRRQWLNVFLLPSAGWTLILILVHQSIVAASSFYLTRLIEAFQHQGEYGSYLIFYLTAMLVPYLPGCTSLFTLQLWINDAHRRFTTRFSNAAYGRTEMHRDSDLRATVESVAARNSFMAIKDYLTFIYGFVGFSLNSALSMLVLSALLPGHLFSGYVISLALSVVLILLLRGTVGRQSTRTENEFIAYSEALSRIWENSTLGNHYNYHLWQSSRDRHASQYYRQSNKLQLLKQSGNLALAVAALLPTIYLISEAIHSAMTEPTLVAAIIVNLTRVFHILGSLSALVYQLLDFSAMNSRLRVMFESERMFSEPSNLPNSPCGEILLNGIPVRDYISVTMSVRSSNQGRFTVRGANGAGKSTLLHVLKKALADDAVLLPAQHGKLEWQHESKALSTGQKTLAQLQEISKHTDVKYLLLDEWDANLDSDNKRAIGEMLDLLSQSKVVVEIRH